MPALCEQFTHRSADSIGVFPAVACTAHWVPGVLYSCATRSQHRQSANRLTLQHWHPYIGLSCNSLLFHFLFSFFILSTSQFAEYGRTRRDLARAEAFFAPFSFNFLDISRACTCHTLQTGPPAVRRLDFRRFLESGLRSSPTIGWTRKQQSVSVT